MISIYIVFALCLTLFAIQEYFKSNPIFNMSLLPFGFSYCTMKLFTIFVPALPFYCIIVGSIVLIFIYTLIFATYYLFRDAK